MFKRIVLLIAIAVCLGLGIYFTYFHRPPTADILAANLALHGRHLQSEGDDAGCGGERGECEYDENEEDPAKKSVMVWNRWIKENKFVSIGRLFDKCNGTDRIMVGTVIMLPDEVNGGVTSRTYVNVTFPITLTGGQMYLTCLYNGNEIYNNHWDLCTVEDGMEGDKIIHCPIRAGRKKFVKNMKIPNYLPKGHYTTKAWLTNQNDEMIGCAFADFRI